jgi:hypothetical protein
MIGQFAEQIPKYIRTKLTNQTTLKSLALVSEPSRVMMTSSVFLRGKYF